MGELRNETADRGVTSRQVARRAIAQGYLEPPIDEKTVCEVSKCIHDLREAGDAYVVDDSSRAYKYDLTEWGEKYYEWLRSRYEKFPPERV